MHFEVSQQHFRNAGGFGVVVALAGVQHALSRSMQRPETALQVSLWDGVYQLIILPYPVEEAGITCAKYGEEHLFFSLPPAHPLSGSKALYMKALNGETMLLRNRLGFWREMAVRKMPDTRFLEQEDVAFNELVQFSALPSFYNGRRAPAGGKPQKPHQHPDFGRRGKRDLLLPLPTGRRRRPAQLLPRDRRGFRCILEWEVIQKPKRVGAGKCFPAPVLLLP